MAQAVATQDPQAAAATLAQSADDVQATSAAVAVAATAGNTQSLAEAAVRAVRDQGASAEALAQALSEASGGLVDPNLLRLGNAGAVAAAVDKGIQGGWVASGGELGTGRWVGVLQNEWSQPLPAGSLPRATQGHSSSYCEGRRQCAGHHEIQLQVPQRRQLSNLFRPGNGCRRRVRRRRRPGSRPVCCHGGG